jgi:hypothetical protein
MVMKPVPVLYKCPKCGWQELHDSPSDVMLRPLPDSCLDCGGRDLDTEVLKGSGLLLKQMSRFIRSHLSSNG